MRKDAGKVITGAVPGGGLRGKERLAAADKTAIRASLGVDISAAYVAASPGGAGTAICKLHLDLHCPEWDESILREIDPARIVRMVLDAGCRSLYFFAKDHYGNAYYATALGHRHRCIGERDLLAEVVAAGHEYGVGVLAYYSVVWDNWCAAHHPDWCMKDPEGQPIVEKSADGSIERWHYVCHNSPYTHYMAGMLEEVAANYEIEGVHLDMFNMSFGAPSCYCEHCRDLYRQRTGGNLPLPQARGPAWRDYLEFRYESVERCQRVLLDTIRARRPGLFVSTNYHGSFGFDWRTGQQPVRHSLASSICTGETYTPCFGEMYPGLEARFLHGLTPGKPVELVCWRMNRITDFTIKPAAQMRWEAWTALAHGASLMVIDQPFHDGSLDEVAYERIGAVFREIDSKRDWIGGEALRFAAVYYSCKTRDWYRPDDPGVFQASVLGAYKALVESHLPVAFLFDETVDAQALQQFPVVWLPNVAVMSHKECELFNAYVREGGVLVATSETSLYSERGGRLEDFQLADLFGVSLTGVIDPDMHYLRNLPSPYGDGLDARQYILSTGRCLRVQPTTAQPLGDLHASFGRRETTDKFFSHNMHPPHSGERGAVFVRRVGRGMVVYMPFGIDASYASEYELPEHRIVMRNAVLAAGHRPAVEVTQAPLNVETVVNRRGKELFVHFLSFYGTRQAVTLVGLNYRRRPSIRMDEPCMYRATLQVNVPFKAVRACGSGTRVEVDGNRISLVCEDVHEVLRISQT